MLTLISETKRKEALQGELESNPKDVLETQGERNIGFPGGNVNLPIYSAGKGSCGPRSAAQRRKPRFVVIGTRLVCTNLIGMHNQSRSRSTFRSIATAAESPAFLPKIAKPATSSLCTAAKSVVRVSASVSPLSSCGRRRSSSRSTTKIAVPDGHRCQQAARP